MFSERRKINQNLRFDVRSLVKYYGELIPGPWGELQVALHLLDENCLHGLGSWRTSSTRSSSHNYNKLAKKGVTNFSLPRRCHATQSRTHGSRGCCGPTPSAGCAATR